MSGFPNFPAGYSLGSRPTPSFPASAIHHPLRFQYPEAVEHFDKLISHLEGSFFLGLDEKEIFDRVNKYFNDAEQEFSRMFETSHVPAYENLLDGYLEANRGKGPNTILDAFLKRTLDRINQKIGQLQSFKEQLPLFRLASVLPQLFSTKDRYQREDAYHFQKILYTFVSSLDPRQPGLTTIYFSDLCEIIALRYTTKFGTAGNVAYKIQARNAALQNILKVTLNQSTLIAPNAHRLKRDFFRNITQQVKAIQSLTTDLDGTDAHVNNSILNSLFYEIANAITNDRSINRDIVDLLEDPVFSSYPREQAYVKLAKKLYDNENPLAATYVHKAFDKFRADIRDKRPLTDTQDEVISLLNNAITYFNMLNIPGETFTKQDMIFKLLDIFNEATKRPDIRPGFAKILQNLIRPHLEVIRAHLASLEENLYNHPEKVRPLALAKAISKFLIEISRRLDGFESGIGIFNYAPPLFGIPQAPVNTEASSSTDVAEEFQEDPQEVTEGAAEVASLYDLANRYGQWEEGLQVTYTTVGTPEASSHSPMEDVHIASRQTEDRSVFLLGKTELKERFEGLATERIEIMALHGSKLFGRIVDLMSKKEVAETLNNLLVRGEGRCQFSLELLRDRQMEWDQEYYVRLVSPFLQFYHQMLEEEKLSLQEILFIIQIAIEKSHFAIDPKFNEIIPYSHGNELLESFMLNRLKANSIPKQFGINLTERRFHNLKDILFQVAYQGCQKLVKPEDLKRYFEATLATSSPVNVTTKKAAFYFYQYPDEPVYHLACLEAVLDGNGTSLFSFRLVQEQDWDSHLDTYLGEDREEVGIMTKVPDQSVIESLMTLFRREPKRFYLIMPPPKEKEKRAAPSTGPASGTRTEPRRPADLSHIRIIGPHGQIHSTKSSIATGASATSKRRGTIDSEVIGDDSSEEESTKPKKRMKNVQLPIQTIIPIQDMVEDLTSSSGSEMETGRAAGEANSPQPSAIMVRPPVDEIMPPEFDSDLEAIMFGISKKTVQSLQRSTSGGNLFSLDTLLQTTQGFIDLVSTETEEVQIGESLLKRYQRNALQKMLEAHHRGHGVILGFEPGLGKTLTSFFFLRELQKKDPRGLPSLIVVPVSLAEQWKSSVTNGLFEEKETYLNSLIDQVKNLTEDQIEKVIQTVLHLMNSHHVHRITDENVLSRTNILLYKLVQNPQTRFKAVFHILFRSFNNRISGDDQKRTLLKEALLHCDLKGISIELKGKIDNFPYAWKELVSSLIVETDRDFSSMNHERIVSVLLSRFENPPPKLYVRLLETFFQEKTPLEQPPLRKLDLDVSLLESDIYEQAVLNTRENPCNDLEAVCRSGSKFIITTSTYLGKNSEDFARITFLSVIVDEVHKFASETIGSEKASYSSIESVVKDVKASNPKAPVVLLTGTPIVNSYSETLSLAQLCNPSLDFSKMERQWNSRLELAKKMLSQIHDESPDNDLITERVMQTFISFEHLRTLLKHLILSASPLDPDVRQDWTNEDGKCMLPTPIFEDFIAELSPEQSQILRGNNSVSFFAKEKFEKSVAFHPEIHQLQGVKDKDKKHDLRGRITALSDPGSLETYIQRSGLLDKFLNGEALEQTIAEKQQALVFVDTIILGNLLKYAMRKKFSDQPLEIKFFYGDKKESKRGELVKWFKKPEKNVSKILIISIDAGGIGLNLPEAVKEFNLSPWWNAATDKQAVYRALRAGTPGEVRVYRYSVNAPLQNRKREIVEIKQLFERYLFSSSSIEEGYDQFASILIGSMNAHPHIDRIRNFLNHQLKQRAFSDGKLVSPYSRQHAKVTILQPKAAKAVETERVMAIMAGPHALANTLPIPMDWSGVTVPQTAPMYQHPQKSPAASRVDPVSNASSSRSAQREPDVSLTSSRQPEATASLSVIAVTPKTTYEFGMDRAKLRFATTPLPKQIASNLQDASFVANYLLNETSCKQNLMEHAGNASKGKMSQSIWNSLWQDPADQSILQWYTSRFPSPQQGPTTGFNLDVFVLDKEGNIHHDPSRSRKEASLDPARSTPTVRLLELDSHGQKRYALLLKL